MDELTCDLLKAIEEEIGAIDQEIKELFEIRRKLFKQREEILAEHSSDGSTASNP